MVFLSDLAKGLNFFFDWLQGVFSFYYAIENLLYENLSL